MNNYVPINTNIKKTKLKKKKFDFKYDLKLLDLFLSIWFN